ncbi:MAG: GTP pyrophosphokinase [Candidatus Magnetoglobus multicellularis str. Araruama]|uniref:GTP pyrophosphokinase n=1 Tax=Candidatus Magnetoglobus multicellularis str. Araruama TaxID=890399 RepID=A0A1V1NTD6_9BACT|nr:MAG: GTP pyrophosphokinase [Candidatus Magnetoglobus multicellularis str. Araruama]
MHLIEKALKIALNVHVGQKDKGNQPYILHPLRLMKKMDSDITKAAALLHDVLEDSDMDVADLANQGIDADIIEIVKLLTKNTHESYETYIDRISTNSIATKIKIADLEDNMNILRLDSIDQKILVV